MYIDFFFNTHFLSLCTVIIVTPTNNNNNTNNILNAFGLLEVGQH